MTTCQLLKGYLVAGVVSLALPACFGSGASHQAEAIADCLQFPRSSGYDAVQSGLILSACPFKAGYRLDEPLYVAVALQNMSEDSIRIRPNFVFGAWLLATVVSPSGDTVPKLEEIDVVLKQPIVLRPGSFVGRIIDVRCPKALPNGECIRPYRLEQPGPYQLTFRFRMLCEGVACEPGRLEVTEIVAPAISVRLRR
jgi:hypothetical protein